MPSTITSGPWAGAGLLSGADETNLEPFSGPIENGNIVRDKIIRQQVNSFAEDVEFHNVWFADGSGNRMFWNQGGKPVLFDHCKFGAPGVGAHVEDGLWGNSVTCLRSEFVGLRDGMKVGNNSLYERCWVHDLYVGGGAHADAQQDTGGARNVVTRYCFFDVPTGANAAIISKSDFGRGDNWLFEWNYFNGGTYTVYVRAGSSIAAPTNQVFRYNRFGLRAYYGLIDDQGPSSTWIGNVADATGNFGTHGGSRPGVHVTEGQLLGAESGISQQPGPYVPPPDVTPPPPDPGPDEIILAEVFLDATVIPPDPDPDPDPDPVPDERSATMEAHFHGGTNEFAPGAEAFIEWKVTNTGKGQIEGRVTDGTSFEKISIPEGADRSSFFKVFVTESQRFTLQLLVPRVA
jgi:hypothetical protein